MRGHWKSISFPNGSLSGFVAQPTDNGFRMPVLLLHDIFGVDYITRQYAATLASQGFSVFCPDLYWRISRGTQLSNTYEDFRTALRLEDSFDVETGVSDARNVITRLTETLDFPKRVHVVGHGLGGRIAFRLSLFNEPVSCACYYGTGLQTEIETLSAIQCPVIFHVGETDFVVDRNTRERLHHNVFKTRLTSQFCVYTGAGHGFTSSASPNYNKAAAELAEARTLEFLSRTIVEPLS